MLNPIEFAFSALKAPLERLLNEQMAQVLDRDLSAAAGLPMTTYRCNLLKAMIEASMHTNTDRKCREWYNHTYRYIPACINLEIIN